MTNFVSFFDVLLTNLRVLGLTKTHFHSIWVQGKILREKHELRVLHEMLANVHFLPYEFEAFYILILI